MDIDVKKLSDEELSVATKVLQMAEKHKIPFSEEQLQTAFKVAEEAKRQNINIDFVLPLVMQESRFNQNAKSRVGCIGVMQLDPDTAKGLNVDPNDLSQNIRGGMRLIKQLASNKQVNNDPIKVLIGYNTKTETRNKYYETEDPTHLPQETLDYVAKISAYSGGDLPSILSEEAPDTSDTSAAVVPEVPQESETAQPVISDQGEKKEDKASKDKISVPIATAAGAALGAKAGVVGAVQKAKYDAFAKYILSADPKVDAKILNKPTSRTGLQNWLNAMLANEGKSVQLPLQKLEEFTGRKIRTAGELGEAYKSIGGTKAERVAKLEPTTGMQKKIYSYKPGSPGMDLSPYQVAQPTALEQSARYGAKLLRLPLTGALAGADILGTSADVYNRLREGDTTGAAISGTGGLAGLASLFLGSAGALPSIAMAAPLYNTASDRLKYLEQNPEAYQLQQESYDPMGNFIAPLQSAPAPVSQTFPLRSKR